MPIEIKRLYKLFQDKDYSKYDFKYYILYLIKKVSPGIREFRFERFIK